MKSITAVAQSLSMASIGFVFARTGVIDANTRKVLSNLSMKITIPCLLFSNILDCPQGATTTADLCPELGQSLAAAWPMLLLPFLWVSVGAGVGWTASLLAPPPIKRTAIAACAFPNSTGLPITLLSALSMVSLTPDLMPAAELRSFLLLLSTYQVTYPVLQWGVGGLLLAERDKSQQDPLILVDAEAAERTRPPAPRLAQKVKEFAGIMLVPPVIAVFFGFFIGLIPALRLLLVDTNDFNNDKPLEFFFNAVLAFGKAAVPMNMMVLGASLASIPNFGSIQWPVTLAVTACKLVLHPAIGFAVICFLDSTGFIAAVTGTLRPSFIVVACLMCATPTANNVQVMAEVSGGPECKRALSAMIFVMYCFSPFVLTFWIVIAISMAQSV